MTETNTDRYVVGPKGSADVAVIDTETGEHAPFYDLRGTGDKAERAASVAEGLNRDWIDRDSFEWRG